MNKTYHVVRADFDDPAGTADRDYLFGEFCTVFQDREQAEQAASTLRRQAEESDWGEAAPPEYYVDQVDEDGLVPAESAQLVRMGEAE